MSQHREPQEHILNMIGISFGVKTPYESVRSRNDEMNPQNYHNNDSNKNHTNFCSSKLSPVDMVSSWMARLFRQFLVLALRLPSLMLVCSTEGKAQAKTWAVDT